MKESSVTCTLGSKYHTVSPVLVAVAVVLLLLVHLVFYGSLSKHQVVFTIMCLEWLFTYVCKPPAEKPWDIFGWNTILIEDEKSVWNQFRKAELQELPGYSCRCLLGENTHTHKHCTLVVRRNMLSKPLVLPRRVDV